MSFKFVDLFAGLGGFHYALNRLGGECVFVSELNENLREIYAVNHKLGDERIFGDIGKVKHLVPEHDVLTAGFPCQPFSKSGKQRGFDDEGRGDCIFHAIDILEAKKPRYFIFENVGNMSRHDNGKTWRKIKDEIENIGYCIRSTADRVLLGESEPLISPHLYGFPQKRERFFAVGSLNYLPRDPFPVATGRSPDLKSIINNNLNYISNQSDTAISDQASSAIDLWSDVINCLPEKQLNLPPFPLWLEEIDSIYPYVTKTPFMEMKENGQDILDIKYELSKLPPYARDESKTFPLWKIKFIDQNREWFDQYRSYIPWNIVEEIRKLDYTYRKLEWNAKNSGITSSNLWDYVLQLRPSGIRVSNVNYVPTIVSMNKSQRPIYGPAKRHLSLYEIKNVFGFPGDMVLPDTVEGACKALGNAVHADVAYLVAKALIEYKGFSEFDSGAMPLRTQMEAA